MPTNPNMVAIQTVTVGSGGAATIEFTNIPQTYTDLVISSSLRGDQNNVGGFTNISFNSSTSNFSSRGLQGDGSTASSFVAIRGVAYLDNVYHTSNTFDNSMIYIPNYAGSNNKSISIDGVQENNATTAFATLIGILWSNTAAITSISLTPNTGNFVQYSTATLYGVTSAGYGAKATGGVIYQDADYFYHTFYSSGTFTPTQNITADCLVIAGGGSGGAKASGGNGGGGGAGGLLLHSAQSLTSSTNYTVTVGAGGASAAEGNAGNNGSNSQFGSLTASVGGGGGGAFYVSVDGVNAKGKNGGSGGGAGQYSGVVAAGGTATSGQGFAGGSNASDSISAPGGGGSGAVGVIGTGTNKAIGGAGGNGLSTYSSWGSATNTGQNVSGTYYYAGGGSGATHGNETASTAGGYGGGGNGSSKTTNGTAGTANSGGGGGGGCDTTNVTGLAGGSGIVIVRYAK